VCVCMWAWLELALANGKLQTNKKLRGMSHINFLADLRGTKKICILISSFN